ncbi:hypothetical protein BT63DRAFT_450862 [Microthyrium microscopicum]|uniref:Uncharacterized protein n=1 Tax=Microthyrium microscopicum TaxID=703497 RepID=A0A6A6UM30_9PEZI|nr:hypothetical protein BT63DRAFT_450862 [Microthyrium microscopicum]
MKFSTSLLICSGVVAAQQLTSTTANATQTIVSSSSSKPFTTKVISISSAVPPNSYVTTPIISTPTSGAPPSNSYVNEAYRPVQADNGLWEGISLLLSALMLSRIQIYYHPDIPPSID